MNEQNKLNRRDFLGVAAGASAASLLPTAQAAEPAPAPAGPPPSAMRAPPLFRAEMDIRSCEVDGTLPSGLNGAFYRIGPDPQYPLNPRNIILDGEGHVSVFRIKNGRVDFRSRYVKTERYLAQDKAGKSLFPLYRNPYMDDPSVKGLSRGTANTHIIHHNNLLLALKEDSPPVAVDMHTLETLDKKYTFNDQLRSQTFTAHPKVDPTTGNIIAFGSESTGFGSNIVALFEIDPQGKMVWNASVKVPYVSLMHDFGVTEKHIILYVYPVALDEEQMRSGGIHWSWDGTRTSHYGVVRRGGDGSDIRWFEGPARSSIHVMNAFEDGNRVYFDGDMADGLNSPIWPNRDGSPWKPIRSQLTRFSVDLSKRRAKDYQVERMYPHLALLPRQDDRYQTVPYRYGFMDCPDPAVADPRAAGACYARFDHQTRTATLFNLGTSVRLQECCFAPKHATAREGEGYLLGVANRLSEHGRSDLLIFDAERLADGPIATVKLPTQVASQIHGWWVPEAQLPAQA
jgi:carotenoid cleavage dioxygenase